MSNVLIVFANYPEPGLVKTRLAKNIGAYNASKLYKSFVPLILNRTKSNEYVTKVFFDSLGNQEQIKEWLGTEWDLLAQSSGSFGQRIKNAFSCIFDQGAEKAVVIGTDSPLLDADLVKKAFAALDKYDCVIGPSSDGGYYLLGIKRLVVELFDLKEWSTNVVFEKTKQKAMKLNCRLKILEEHFNIDEEEDLIRLYQKLGKSEYCKEPALNKLKIVLKDILKK